MSLLSKTYRVFLTLTLLFVLQSATAQQCEKLDALIEAGKLLEAASLVSQFEADKSNSLCLNQIGEYHLRKGQTDKALLYFERALDLANNESGKAEALNKIALASWSAGDNNKALNHMLLALEIREKSQQDLAATYNDFGLILSNSDTDAALDNYLKALKLYQAEKDVDEAKVVQVKSNIASMYRQLEFYGDAILNFEEALSLSQQLYPTGHPIQGFIFFGLGDTYFAMGQMEDARLAYNNALDTYLKVYEQKHPDIARTYNRIGNLINSEGEFEQALNFYQKALIANTYDFEKTGIEHNPTHNNYLDANTLMNSLYFKAQALEDYHFNFSLDFKDLKMSLSTLYVCDSLIDEIRKVSTNKQDKIALGAISDQVYENGVRIGYAMADLSLKKDEYFEHAFYFAEKSKSAVLLQAISDASAKSFANIPKSQIEIENKFKTEIAFYEQKLSEHTADSEQYRTSLFELKKEYAAFVKSLEKEYPEYYNLKYNINIPSIDKLQNRLSDNTALISYFIADATLRIYIFQITNKKLKVDNVSQTEDFDRYLSGFRNSLYFKEKEIYKITGEALYDLLFPSKLSKSIEHLVIIPAGRLGTIPFEALLTENTKQTDFNYAELPYLINDYSVSYQYASTLFYVNAGKSTSDETDKAALLCAPVQFQTLQDLPGSGQEVASLKTILENKGVKPDVLLEANATETDFKTKELNKYNYLHFATHGIVDEYSPELSRIFLRQDNDQDNDGNLYSGEIYNLNLSADLVTLSACETGLGKISKGEGIIGLSRALVYAGAQNIMVSLWKVADNSTASLMTNFYQNIESEDYSKSLRQAKVEMIKSQYSQPFYWAPFVLIGN
ncbi:CHAT domain-containing protein [Fulvivirga aurantia]|uniref:CHAT domain-containing protein n=1 Tax=Fulvivirga aurantia TaxID=2529383 RepID=UPI0016271369|nr:CHAT domain-containing tetratricopeptide repeat protein [Fulvivirga aurantia]